MGIHTLNFNNVVHFVQGAGNSGCYCDDFYHRSECSRVGWLGRIITRKSPWRSERCRAPKRHLCLQIMQQKGGNGMQMGHKQEL